MKIGVAMSGGVDSSTAALLLENGGHEVIGINLLLCEPFGSAADDAAKTAEKLGIEFHAIDMREEFRAHVIDKFIADYEKGLTPNPCVVCNREIKFGRLLLEAEKLGCDGIATGHYARIEKDGGRFLLKKGLDESKDQSYMLYSLTQNQLSKALFPLGGLNKTEVRRIAEENGLVSAHRKDSQDICFIPDGDYAAFIERNAEKTFPAGDFIGTHGEIYGRHKGIIHYTVGQRKGLGLSFPQPMFVKSIDAAENTVTLGKAEELFSNELSAKDVNLVAAEGITEPTRVKAKIRYHHREAEATAYPPENGAMKIVFDEPQRAVTGGQSVVMYQGDTVFGGGIII